MQLRLYAMYERSRVLLILLVTSFLVCIGSTIGIISEMMSQEIGELRYCLRGSKKFHSDRIKRTGWHKRFVASYPTYSRSSVLLFNFFASLLHLFLGSHTDFRSLDFHTLSPKGHRLRSRIRFFSITSDERNSYQRFYIILHCVSASLSL